METLQRQFGGYGSTAPVVARCLERLELKQPLQDWSDETIERVVNAFTDEKFPTVIALNKIDHADADKVRLTFIYDSSSDHCRMSQRLQNRTIPKR